MMNYMRRDGEYTIYLIEEWDEKHQRWERCSPRHPKGFDSCGECWQTTGIHGTFDYDQALDGAGALQREFGGPFRVVVMEISQRVMVPPERVDRSGMSWRPFPTRNRFVLRAVVDLDDKQMEGLFDEADRRRPAGADQDVLAEAFVDYIEVEVPQRIRDLYGVREVMES